MNGPVIRAEGLGKRFVHTLPRSRTLLGRLSGGAAGFPVWALRGVSFEARPGECLGLSGPNGAGKSTLLALIAGILEPTEGKVAVSGRTNAFLNIHAGLQAELSVRDNIEICGILMGLTRRQVLDRTDAVLDFAELAAFADVRLAELSTGQAARVAFSTALRSELDVLVVDEALSVGDAAFQEKCARAFAALRGEGKTMLVASHDEALLERLSTRRLRLLEGRLL